ncbi:hypothetical protein F5Y00DRAFT_274327 [Daldinia vernicosa]|uniref:uncharacterized protein n=1 Tax=Daldinia vernicosa TaxID=114800 RepID=UPI00200832F9|nr:uncharacterized protein F5Y00DRAFT_274327 [Daldinia vernicosa]KAI0852126.1 hypothetical protein F5Y00DRAFT_274327 [Daldinia vernicosa]
MHKLSQVSVNDSAKSEGASVNSHSNQGQHSTSIHKYTAGVLSGDAPVSTLIGLRNTDLNIAPRYAKVHGEVEDALAKLAQRPNQYVSFRLSYTSTHDMRRICRDLNLSTNHVVAHCSLVPLLYSSGRHEIVVQTAQT